MAYSLLHQSPADGHIAWTGVHIVFDGTDYPVADGSTARRYVWWLASSPTIFQTGDVLPSLGPEDALVFINRGGVGISVLDSALVHGGMVVEGTIASRAIAAGAIRAEHLSAGAITAEAIEAYAINAEHLTVEAIEARHIRAEAIDADKLAAGAVTAGKISAGAVGAAEIAAGAVTAGKIGAGEVIAGKLGVNAVEAGNIAANAVTAGTIAAGAVVADSIAAGAILASKIAVGDSTNIYPDPNLLDPVFYSSSTGSPYTFAATNFDDYGLNALQLGVDAADRVVETGWFEVSPNTAYWAEVAMRRTGGTTGTASAEIEWGSLASTGVTTPLSPRTSLGSTSITSSARYGGPLISPNTARRARFVFTRLGGGDGIVTFGRPELRRRANGELIVDGAITALKIDTGAVTADKIAARAVTAEKLLIGDFQNRLENPRFEADLTGWTVALGNAAVISDAASAYAGPKYLSIVWTAADGALIAHNTRTPVIPGERYYLRGSARAVGPNQPLLLRVTWRGASGADVSTTDPVTFPTTDTAWTTRGAVLVAPAGAATLEIAVRVPSGGTAAGSWDVGEIFLARQNTGELIVDGSITADKILAGTITGDRLQAFTIDADRLAANSVTAGKIAAGAVSAAQISAGAITASKLVVADTSNMYPDPNLLDPDFYASSTGSPISFGATSLDDFGSNALVIGPDAADRVIETAWFEVAPNTAYRAEIAMRRQSGTTGTVSAEIEWGSLAAIGTITPLSPRTSLGSTSITSSARYGAPVVSPNTARRARFVVTRLGGGDGNVTFGRPELRRRANADLIVDGAVTADKIDTAAVTAGKIAAGAVTTAKLAVGSPSNVIWNPCLGTSDDGWRYAGVIPAVGARGVAPATYYLDAFGSGYMSVPALSAGQSAEIFWAPGSGAASGRIPASPGQVWEAQARLLPRIGEGLVTLRFYNAAGGLLTSFDGGVVAPSGLTSGTRLSDYTTSWVIGTAPANTAFVDITLRLRGPGSGAASSPVLYFTQAALGPTAPNATEPQTWSPGGVTEITGGIIRTNSIVARNIAAGTITATELAAGAVTAGKIAAGAIRAEHIAANAITADMIDAYAVRAEHLMIDAIRAEHLSAESIQARHITAGAIEAEMISANAVTAGAIAAGAINASHLSANSVRAEAIQAGAVNADKLAANAVTADKILAGAVTAAKLASTNLITQTAQISDGIITTAKIGDLQVSGAKIANGAITSAKIGTAQINNAHIGDLQVTTAKIADLQVDTFKIAGSAVTGVAHTRAFPNVTAWRPGADYWTVQGVEHWVTLSGDGRVILITRVIGATGVSEGYYGEGDGGGGGSGGEGM